MADEYRDIIAEAGLKKVLQLLSSTRNGMIQERALIAVSNFATEGMRPNTQGLSSSEMYQSVIVAEGIQGIASALQSNNQDIVKLALRSILLLSQIGTDISICM